MMIPMLLCAISAFRSDGAAKMPPIPTSGWQADQGRYRSWSQTTVEGGAWQIADYNADHKVD